MVDESLNFQRKGTIMSENKNTASTYNWGEELKVEVGDLTSRAASNSAAGKGAKKSFAPLPTGRHAAFVQTVQHGTFKSGSYGLTITYVIEGGEAKNRKIKEYLVLTKSDGTKMDKGGARLKQRLMAFGVPVEKINAFKPPRNEHDLGDLKFAISAPVTIIVAEDSKSIAPDGIPYRRVAGVYLRNLEETSGNK